MNLDLLTKLVKLANNNPNEHEANSAARRACKLIADAKFIFQPDVKVAENRAGTYGAQTRSTETPWKGTPPQPASNPFTNSNPFEDYFRYGSWTDWYDKNYDPTKTSKDYDDETARRRAQQNEPKKEKPKTKRTCSECGIEKETTSTDRYYICAGCQWEKYGKI